MFIDTHCHLDFPEFAPDRKEMITRSLSAGVEYMINVGSSLHGSQRSVELAGEFPCLYACVGIHPHEADNFPLDSVSLVRELAGKDKVVAIGEAGLDYYKNFSRAENQGPLFLSMIKLAKERGLPLVIHTRQAEAETLEIIKAQMPVRGVIHCFSGDGEFLKRCLELGFFISFTCNVTYKKAQGLRDVIKLAPLERIMLETDAPYLSPEGLRGKRNEPLNVRFVAEEIARIKGIKVEEVGAATTANAKGFFKLK